MSAIPMRPRLLMTAASIMVANGGGKPRRVEDARFRERALEAARLDPGASSHAHSFQAHVAALADLIVSVNAAKDSAACTPLKPVK